ncbi:hypothetical protein Tco_0374793 [Tanacetum coccineum]
MDSNFNNKNKPWEFSLDIDDSDLHLTPVVRSSSSTHVEPSPYTPNPVTIIPGHAGIVQLSSSTRVEPSPSTSNPVRIIPGPVGIVQQTKLLKERDILLGWDGAVTSTQEYMQKVVEDVDEDVILTVGLKSCSPNMLGDLNVTLKDLSGTIPETIHYKVLDVGSYEKDINVGAAMILANVSGTPETSDPYGGYAIEIFLEDSLYAVCDIITDFTGLNRKIIIPKEMMEGLKKVGGNLIFFHEKLIKPTLSRPAYRIMSPAY